MAPHRSARARSALARVALLLVTAPGAHAELPALPFGTWHVLVHYQRPEGRHPHRWLWDERVWVIEPTDGALTWTEHGIVRFRDTTGRFENLGTNRARRLIGAWTPNEDQRDQLATGVGVDSRGMRRKQLDPDGRGGWRSEADVNPVGQSAGGAAYHEDWSISSESGEMRFEIASRFELQGATESGGSTRYQVAGRDGDAWTGTYRQGEDRVGRFRMTPTRILVEAEGVADDPSAPSGPDVVASVELVPDRRVHSDVPLLVSVLRPFHYYGDRSITIDSTPPGAQLDVAYLRRGSQLLYRRGRAPLEAKLPTRLQTDDADRILIRGFLPGYERARYSIAASTTGPRVQLDLVPLRNQLRDVAHGHVAGRSVLELVSLEEPTVRVGEDDGGFSVVLLRTGLAAGIGEKLNAFRDPLFRIDGRQLGEDLVLRLESLQAEPLDLRQVARADPARAEFRTRLLISGPSSTNRVERIRLALEDTAPSAHASCEAPFESVLRASLGEKRLLASLGREDHAERATLRAALRRLAETAPDHRLSVVGDKPLFVSSPIEFEVAWSRRTKVDGYLSWLHRLAGEVEPEDAALAFRSWVAPSWPPSRFDALLARAVAARSRCEERL